MQRQRNSDSMIVDTNKYLIQKQYLNVGRHKQNLQYSKKCIYFYQKINSEIEAYYHIIYSIPSKVKDNIILQRNQDNRLLAQFKTFLNNFFQIFTQLSNFQIEGLSKIRSSVSDILDNSFQSFILGLQKYYSLQVDFQKDKQAYKSLCSKIENKYAELQNIFKKVEQNFNSKKIKAEYDSISQELSQKDKLQQNLVIKMQQIGKNSQTFEKQLMFYRQKLVVFKYESIDKINRLCKNAKQSLMQVLTYMHDCIKTSKNGFGFDRRIEQFKANANFNNERKQINEYINKCTREYDQQINRYLQIIRLLISVFTSISIEIKDQKNRHSQIIEQMNKYFEFGECNVNQILSTLDSYKLFLKHLSELGDKLVFSQNNFLYLQKNVNKHKEIALTILKCNKNEDKRISTQAFRQSDKIKQNDSNYLDNLFQQMNEAYILKNVEKVFRDIEEAVSKIRDKFMVNQPVRKKINNSMSMSYIQASQIQIERRPFKPDFWLWKQWRKQMAKQFIDFPQIKGLVNEMGTFIQKTNSEQKQSQKLKCVFVAKKINGILKLKPTAGLYFESTDNTRQYSIPFYKIENVDMDFTIMSKAFVVQTVHGSLAFADENVKEIKNFHFAVKKALNHFNQNNQEGKVEQNVVELSEEEIEFIKERRVKIEKDLQNLSQYEHYNTIVFEDVSITDVYRVIFSDNKITIKGKEYECFIDSLTKKFNNFNQRYTKFQPSGPQYYTGVSGVNFKNCALFSQRKMQFDHTLPKIPFLPSFCHNAQTARIFWVSHEQFHLKQTNVTSGAPYTQNFITTTFSTVHKIQQNVQVRFFIKTTLVVDFALKKVVLKTAVDEAKMGNSVYVEQAKKIMLSYKRKNNKQSKVQAVEQSVFSDKTRVKQFKKKINDLQQKNKYLIYVLGGILLLNILLKILF